MKIIIIGAKGMLGQELANIFAAEKTLLWDKEEIDITDQLLLNKKITAENPDLIINAAAYNDVDGAETNEKIAYAVNSDGPKNLAQAAKKAESILIHYSTDYVFKGDRQEGYKEDDEKDPQSVYAASKSRGEDNVISNMDKYYIIRLSRLFGQPANAEGAKKSFIDVMLGLAKDKKELDIVDEELSSPTYAPDLAKQTKKIIDEKMDYGLYHAANSGACTWYDFAKEAFAIKNVDVRINPVPASKFPRPAKRPEYSILINTKLPEIRSWQKALKDYLKND